MYKPGSRKGTIRFSLPSDGRAKAAALAADFTNWQPVPMRKQKGTFAVTLPVGQGQHEYKFVVDGSWVTDPDNALCAPNGLGSMNSIVQV